MGVGRHGPGVVAVEVGIGDGMTGKVVAAAGRDINPGAAVRGDGTSSGCGAVSGKLFPASGLPGLERGGRRQRRMNMNARWLLRAVFLGWLLSVSRASCLADGPLIVNHMLAGENFFVALRPNTNDWIW
jgi:hypothetical protein